MGIKYFEESQTFKLDACDSSYVFRIFMGELPLHLYYGKKIDDISVQDMFDKGPDNGATITLADLKHPNFKMAVAPMEFSGNGTADFRHTSISIENSLGNSVTDMRYKDYKITKGKPKIKGLPSLYADEADCETLELILYDKVTGAEAHVFYTVFENYSVITRSVKVVNPTDDDMYIENIMSCTVDLPFADLDMVSLYGRANKERSICTEPLRHGVSSVESRFGASSHYQNPFVALKKKNASEDFGEVYGFNLVYSGNFLMEAEVDAYNCTRFQAGINPHDFKWKLEAGDEFSAPEVVMVYSDNGLGQMSRTFHSLYRNHLIPRKWKTAPRPLLINSWEAAYFNINTKKILDFAASAKELGIEMIVVDDGWFGCRNNDSSSLGDWFAFEEKFPNGLGELIDGVHAMGMKFGLWFEPEMISEDSELFRAHPDWYLHIEGRKASTGRKQYVLDMTRDEVVDNIWTQIDTLLKKHPFDYIKWDFNRNLSEVGSASLPKDRQKEVYHRFILGTYKLMGRLTENYPDLLLENCASGGGRFDAGILSFSPQIWCSDCTDAIERLTIQTGTSLCYPISTMGSHVSDSKRTSFKNKGNVAQFGTFGYELDPLKMTEEEREEVKIQVAEYHKYHDIIANGDFYRLINPEDSTFRTAWMSVSQDKTKAVVLSAVMRTPPYSTFILRLKGLDSSKKYRRSDNGIVYSGSTLMNAGINLSRQSLADGTSELIYFEEI